MYSHVPVLLEETIANLKINPSGIYVDATLGRGGHSSRILSLLENGFLYCFDVDNQAIKDSETVLASISNRFEIIHENFRNLKSALRERNVNKVNGFLFDLGVSSAQFDEGDRGFSYRYDARLDMRMNQESKLTAYDVINFYSKEDLKKIFLEYGEEKYASQIASSIVGRRQSKPLETTFELVDIIKSSLPFKELRKKGHPAKQVFQAIRIEVNDELNALKDGLEDAINMLERGGRIAVITFHSLEDRIVKNLFKKYTYPGEGSRTLPLEMKQVDYVLVNKKVILPSPNEIEANPRSQSAKLRVIERKMYEE